MLLNHVKSQVEKSTSTSSKIDIWRLFKESNNVFCALRRACSQERPGRKPYCISNNELFSTKNFIILLCINFLYILKIVESKEIGLQLPTSVLEPYSCIGMTLVAILNCSGKIPCRNDLFNIVTKVLVKFKDALAIISAFILVCPSSFILEIVYDAMNFASIS